MNGSQSASAAGSLLASSSSLWSTSTADLPLSLQHHAAYRYLSEHLTLVLAVPTVLILFLVYYVFMHVRRPVLHYPSSPLNDALMGGLQRLHRAYWPTFYVTHEIAQAAIGSFVRFDPHIKADPLFERDVRTMADGEQIALDWLHPHESNDETPIVFTCHGLGGHTDELNMQYLALAVRDGGFRFAIFNRRGCALDMKLTRDFLYLWGSTSDMREILAHIKRRYPRAPILGVGFSAGSNLLTKYLGETGAESLIDVGLSVANAYNVRACSEYLAHKPFYSFIMVNILKNMLARNEDTFRRVQAQMEREALKDAAPITAADTPQTRQRKLDLSRVKQVRNVLEWDEHFSLTTHRQYTDLDHFYSEQSTTPDLIANIRVPLFNLHALDDPILSDEMIPQAALRANKNIMLATTSRGGHLGYTEGLFPFNSATWMERLAVEYFQLAMRPDVWKMIREKREKERALARAKAEADAQQQRFLDELQQQQATRAIAAATAATRNRSTTASSATTFVHSSRAHTSTHARSHTYDGASAALAATSSLPEFEFPAFDHDATDLIETKEAPTEEEEEEDVSPAVAASEDGSQEQWSYRPGNTGSATVHPAPLFAPVPSTATTKMEFEFTTSATMRDSPIKRHAPSESVDAAALSPKRRKVEVVRGGFEEESKVAPVPSSFTSFTPYRA